MRTLASTALVLAATVHAQQGDPILAALPADAANVVVVRDVMPVLDRLLAAPATSALLTATAGLQSEVFGRVLDAAAVRRQLATVAVFVPREVVVAAPASTLDWLSHAGALFCCVTVLQIMERSGVTDAAVLERIRTAARTHAIELDALALQAWVVTRDERTAEGWFDTLAERAPALAPEFGFTATVADARITLRGNPWAADSPARRALAAVGVSLDAALAAPIEVVVEQSGARLSLRAGEMAPGPCAPARLGAAWTGAAEQVLFARSEPGERLASLAEAYGSIAKLGGVEVSMADALTMPRLVEFLGRIDALSSPQTVSLRLARDVEWLHEMRSAAGADAAATLPAALLCLLDDEEPSFATVDALDALLAESLTDLDIDDAAPGTLGEALEQYLDDEASAVFAPGVLLLARPAAMRGRQGRAEPLPFAAMALVARPRSAADGAAFVHKLTELWARHEGADPATIWKETELGLGAPAHVLDPARIAPEIAAQRFDWDFVPHWFANDELLILSTDPALTKELLARSRRTPPPAPAGAFRHSVLNVPGARIADAAGAMLQWAPVLREFDADQVARSVPLWEMARTIAGVIDRIDAVSETRGGVRSDRFTVRLRAAPPK